MSSPSPRRRPCKACPWRVSAKPEDIPTYDPARAANLAVTCRDDGLNVMACHESRVGAEFVCAGFVLSVGPKSIGARLLASRGLLNPDDFYTDEPLHPDFEAMHRAQGVVTPPRNRVEDRPSPDDARGEG